MVLQSMHGTDLGYGATVYAAPPARASRISRGTARYHPTPCPLSSYPISAISLPNVRYHPTPSPLSAYPISPTLLRIIRYPGTPYDIPLSCYQKSASMLRHTALYHATPCPLSRYAAP
eukprot:3941832-Rhodomonas_salina.2